MDIYVGTVIRSADVSNGGELIRLDWKNKQIKARVPIFPCNPNLSNDPNPRGNTRGCRGIVHRNGNIIIANYHTLKIFDLNLKHIRDITHKLMVGLHEIDGLPTKRVWVASTAIDAALEFDLDTGELLNQFWPREMPLFQRQLGLEPMVINKSMDNRTKFLGSSHSKHPSHLHLNAVRVWKEQVYALFNHFGVVANLSNGEIMIRDQLLDHSHNLVITDDGIAILNNTFRQKIHFYELKTGKLLNSFDLNRYPWVRKLKHSAWMKNYINLITKLKPIKSSIARPLFLRGLELYRNKLFIGISPAAILCIDRYSGELLDMFKISNDVRVCVHGLKVVNGKSK
jgi:hypothetical protein